MGNTTCPKSNLKFEDLCSVNSPQKFQKTNA